MKKLGYLLILLIILSACNKFEDPVEEPINEGIMDLEIPDGFTFETSYDLDIILKATHNNNQAFNGLVYRIYSWHPDEGGELIASGTCNEEGIYTTSLNLPEIQDSIYISSNYLGITGGMFAIESNPLVYEYHYTPVLPNKSVSAAMFDNIVTDFEDGLDGWTAYRDNGTYNAVHSTAANTPLGYGPNGTDDKFMWGFDTQGGVRSFKAPSEYNGNIYGNYIAYDYYLGNTGTSTALQAGIADIRITNGSQVLSIDLDAAFPHQVNSGWQTFYVKLDETATAGSGWRIGNMSYWTTGNGKRTLSNTPASAQQIQQVLSNVTGILIAPEGQVGQYSQNGPEFICVDNFGVVESLDDITIYTQGGSPEDADNDGVPDDQDDYPTDPDKAFNNYSPSENSYGTLAFEDLWPERGDYDFNDLVIDYRFNVITNADNKAVEMETEFVIQAAGAGFINGFGFELPVSPSAVESVSGLNHSEGYLNTASNGTEIGQTNAIIIPFDNPKALMGANSSFVNTVIGDTYYDPVTINNTIVFSNPVETSTLGTAPYNPVLIANGSRGVEIHLPGNTPTDLAETTLFGTAFDDTNPAAGKYYQSANNLPWAIHIPVSFAYPKEKASIESAHLKFAEWAESGGSVFQDWYLDNSGYRNGTNIYTH